MKIFITGTDTDCGKTYVTCQLLNHFKAQKKTSFALKPIASGCKEINGLLQNDDVELLKLHNSSGLPINGWQFAAPISPHLAAKADNQQLSAVNIANFCLANRFSPFDIVLVEGAGGLMVPFNDEETWIDFLKLTDFPVIVVVGMRLGCINHALLTDAVLKMNKIKTLGWIANCLAKDMLALDENIATLRSKMQMPLLAVLPYQGKFTEALNLEEFFEAI
ncbi:MAG: dethiobiotin synthase [Tatlockia sp.]|nr:dethiobiotin synthase [Tatlockia sp.]